MARICDWQREVLPHARQAYAAYDEQYPKRFEGLSPLFPKFSGSIGIPVVATKYSVYVKPNLS